MAARKRLTLANTVLAILIWPIWANLWPIHFWIWCVPWWGPKVEARKVGGARGRDFLGKCAARAPKGFFFLLRTRRGFTRQPKKLQTCHAHFRPRRFKNNTKIPREDTQRERRKNEISGGREKKKSEIFGPHPSGPDVSWVWAPPFGAKTHTRSRNGLAKNGLAKVGHYLSPPKKSLPPPQPPTSLPLSKKNLPKLSSPLPKKKPRSAGSVEAAAPVRTRAAKRRGWLRRRRNSNDTRFGRVGGVAGRKRRGRFGVSQTFDKFDFARCITHEDETVAAFSAAEHGGFVRAIPAPSPCFRSCVEFATNRRNATIDGFESFEQGVLVVQEDLG